MPPRILEEDASILVYKHCPERTGFNIVSRDTQQQLTSLALLPCKFQVDMYNAQLYSVQCKACAVYSVHTHLKLRMTIS